MRRGSKGLGIRYSAPKAHRLAAIGGGGLGRGGGAGKGRDAFDAASSISSLIVVAPHVQRAPKMKGKQRTLFTWFGKSDRPVR